MSKNASIAICELADASRRQGPVVRLDRLPETGARRTRAEDGVAELTLAADRAVARTSAFHRLLVVLYEAKDLRGRRSAS
jgi:hypothetical protein